MKYFKICFFFAALLLTGIAVSSCGNKSTRSTGTEQQGKEYTSAYVCPLHCEESGSDEAGKCPVCGMDYVLNEDHNKDRHKH